MCGVSAKVKLNFNVKVHCAVMDMDELSSENVVSTSPVQPKHKLQPNLSGVS